MARESKHFPDIWKAFQSSFPSLLNSVVFGFRISLNYYYGIRFSTIAWEKDDHWFSLTDMSLEGNHHAKQSGTLAHVEEYAFRMYSKKIPI
jgi:hypothetical protein